MSKTLAYIINVDWYFRLHWVERARYFKSLGYNIHVISSFTDSNIESELISMGFVCHQVSFRRKSINIIREFIVVRQLKTLLKIIEPDLIHCITIKPNIYSGLLNKFFFNKPIVFGVTGLGAVFSSKSLKFRFLRRLVRVAYKLISIQKSRFIFENSEDHRLFSDVDILKYSNGHVIKGAGIDLERFSSSLPPGNKCVLFAARLLTDKGLHCLVDAKHILRNRKVYITLNVAGIIDNDVSSAIPLRQMELWANRGDIIWLGNVKDMPNLIKNNDIVCLPTTYGEGVPRILIEAAASQRAIVATDVAGCREIVTHGFNGLLAIPNDAESLANCLQDILENYEKTLRFGISGRKKAEAEFAQEMVFEKTLLVYRDLLAS